MNEINGGMVKQIFPVSTPHGAILVEGIWSGGTWGVENQFLVRQFKNQVEAGTWRIARVTLVKGKDVMLTLIPETFGVPLDKGDILIFGEGNYTVLDVKETNLPFNTDRAIQFGNEHYRGIALAKNEQITKILLFHSKEVSLDLVGKQPVLFKGQEFFARLTNAKPLKKVKATKTHINAYKGKGLLRPIAHLS